VGVIDCQPAAHRQLPRLGSHLLVDCGPGHYDKEEC
jgi:hypothetical protein